MAERSAIQARAADLEREEQKFNASLGTFILAWSDLEADMYKTLLHYSGVSDAVGRAIFSGTRAKGAMEFLKTIAHNINLGGARKVDLDFVLPQVAALSTMRDKVVHFTSAHIIEYDVPMTRLISNASRVSRYKNEWIEQIGTGTLVAMTFDSSRISYHLYRHYSPQYEKRFVQFRHPQDGPTTWLYKPSQPSTKNPPTVRGRERRPRPQKPSGR